MLKNKNLKQSGFTLVELLIVIVIIAILAAITVVAYNGIQNRARASSLQSATETVTKKAEAANAIASAYPSTIANFNTDQQDSSLLGSGITLLSGAPTAANTTTNSSVSYRKCTTPASGKPAQQAEVGYWNFSTGAAVYNYLGGTAAADCTTWGSYVAGGPF